MWTLKMNIETFDDNYAEEWEMGYQVAYTSGKPAPMKSKRRKPLTARQKIERFMDKAKLDKDIGDFAEYN
ncbi:hypothetical protein GCM10017161_19250 [Thalassotalea marina]|uniref:Uncharacterized protein n=2 Tax=Thalassotalea marina TaxID=1673741 RepID=A0A919BH82_9GAMM|nr:hypothetical protein GCM10017161_19250 [Thalassotalea marina]